MNVEQIYQVRAQPLELRRGSEHALSSNCVGDCILEYCGCERLGSGCDRKMNETISFISRLHIRSGGETFDGHRQVNIIHMIQVASLADNIN